MSLFLQFALFALCVSVATGVEGGAALATDNAAGAPESLNLLLFDVRLDNEVLADTMTAYEADNDVLLPLGELMRLLTLGIRVDPNEQVASGFVLRPERGFRLEVATGTVTTETGQQHFDPSQVRMIEGDMYVASRLLQRCLPLDFDIDFSSLSIAVVPREKLPLQARLERERTGARQASRDAEGGTPADLGYPHVPSDYRLISAPFIDQTLGFDYNGGNGKSASNWAYSSFLTADLAGMEASMYVSSNQAKPSPDARLTLSRNDPDAGLLWPMQARTVALGNVSVPSLANVLRGSGSGDGLLVSNRPLNQSTSYGLQTLRGDLPPGWDVTLYINDALIGFQQSRPDGLYEFSDQPLAYGTNEFRLVFNGPLGQARVERKTFILDQTLTKPGEFYYTLAGQNSSDGKQRQTMQFDVGLSKNLAATGGVVALPLTLGSAEQRFYNLGLRASTLGMLLSGDYVQSESGGSLYDLSLRTALGRFSLNVNHTQLQNGFVSDFYAETSDPIKSLDTARVTGSLPLGEKLRLPVAINLSRQTTQAGVFTDNAQARVSLNVLHTSLTNSLNWYSTAGNPTADGVLQISRRVAGIGLSGQVAYLVKPDARVSSYAMSLDKKFGDATRLNMGALHTVDNNQTTLTMGLNHNLKSFGVGLSGSFVSNGDYGMSIQLFMAIGRDPHTGDWVRDWQPMAGSGAVSARTFLDANMNGVYDPGEEPIPDACFILNGGSRHPTCSNADGLAYLSHLTPKKFTDIGLDTATLENPQWQPEYPGMRILPRPGKVQSIDFPVVITGEIDGTVYLLEQDKKRGIGNALIELLDAQGKVVSTVRSPDDGYYIIPAVPSGHYLVRISPEQLDKLGLRDLPGTAIEIRADGEFVNGIDFTVQRKP